jgi:WD40 repeat protein
MKRSIGLSNTSENHGLRVTRGSTTRRAFGLPWPGRGLLAFIAVPILAVFCFSTWDPSGEKTEPREIAALRGPAESICSLAFSPDQTTLATIGRDQSLVLWDVGCRRIVAEISNSPHLPHSIAYTADGRLLVTANIDGTVSLREAASCRETKVLAAATAAAVGSLAVAPQGGILALRFRTGEITLLDLDSGRVRARIAGHQGNVSCLVFRGDGAVFASAGADGAVRLWETASGRLLKTFSGHRCAMSSLAFSPDGKALASAGSVSGEVKLWDVSTGRQLRSFTIADRVVTSLVYSPDGRILLVACGLVTTSGQGQGTIHLWDLASGRERGRLTGHTNWIACLSLSADGTILASGEPDPTVRLWSIAATGETR